MFGRVREASARSRIFIVLAVPKRKIGATAPLDAAKPIAPLLATAADAPVR